jgi:hypothetical protein
MGVDALFPDLSVALDMNRQHGQEICCFDFYQSGTRENKLFYTVYAY